MQRIGILFVFILYILSSEIQSQALPQSLKLYLDRNYRGWKLAGECYINESENKRVLVADFDGNGKTDYAVKFTRGKKGFFMAFLEVGRSWAPFYLHIYSANDARFSDLMLMGRGERYPEGKPKLKFDSPADFRCESDVGGVHTFRKGRFIAH